MKMKPLNKATGCPIKELSFKPMKTVCENKVKRDYKLLKTDMF